MNKQHNAKQTLSIDESEADDILWSAFADPSRRRILDLLRAGPMTTNDLCTHFAFTRFAVMKHLKILEQGGLVLVERRGRERLNHLNPLPIQSIYRRWIQPFEQIPADRMLRLKLIAEQNEENSHEQ